MAGTLHTQERQRRQRRGTRGGGDDSWCQHHQGIIRAKTQLPSCMLNRGLHTMHEKKKRQQMHKEKCTQDGRWRWRWRAPSEGEGAEVPRFHAITIGCASWR